MINLKASEYEYFIVIPPFEYSSEIYFLLSKMSQKKGDF